MSEPGYMSAAEAAEELGISSATLYAYVSRGLIRSETGRDSRSRRYRTEDVWALKRRKQNRREPDRAAEDALHWGLPVLQSSLSLIRDAEIETTIRIYAAPLFEAAQLDPQAVRVMIVNDPRLNAFVAGGQRIFINTGLLMATKAPNELISVIAHETGHIIGGHLARTQEALRNASVESILTMVLGGVAAAAGGGQAAGAIIAVSVAASRALAPIDMAIGNWKGVVAARQAFKRLRDTMVALSGMVRPLELPAPTKSLKVDKITVAPPASGRVLLTEVAFELTAGQR